MGYPAHFVGIVRRGRVADLFGSEASQAEQAHDDGSIVEVLGDNRTLLAPPGSAQSSLYQVAAKQQLDPVFPSLVKSQVQELLDHPGIDDPNLVDLSEAPFVTIDGADSMDLDQAVWVEEAGDGHLVHYALADASYYVRPGTPLHNEALRRGASYYLPGIMIPMLPRALSEGLISLNADVFRRSVVFSMKLDREGRCVETAVKQSKIRSQGKLSFQKVQDFYDGGPGFGPEVDRSLGLLAEVGRQRMQLAEERGVVRYRREEVSAKLSGGGVRFMATGAARLDVERFNEQLSLLCNIEGARILAKHGADYVEPIYRVHPAPSDEKIKAFEKMLAAVVIAQDLDRARWLWTARGELPLWKFLDELPTEGAQGRIATAVHRQAVMANVRSTFQTQAGSHHGVGAEVYARFSAPMREMIGVFLHKELLEAQAGAGHSNASLRQEVLSRANASKATQRTVTSEGNRLVIEQIFGDQEPMKSILPGTLMGMEGAKAYVRLDQPPIDIKVYLKYAPVQLRPSKDGASLLRDGVPRHHLGDSVGVQVVSKDTDRDRWVLQLTDYPAHET